MSLVRHLQLAGAALILLALLHAGFPRRFKWHEETARLSPLNRQILFVHSFFIAVTLAIFGVLSFVIAASLAAPSAVSRTVLAGFVVFWLLRLLTQLFVYEASLWRGNRFNTAMHVLFAAFWTYLVSVYGTALWMQTTATRSPAAGAAISAAGSPPRTAPGRP
ncbi:MAG TPA: hypothetical protein VEQ84_18695 [Vicinamibacteria bacterium]|nr:hypothetical protein [Vicinamibacteria bacterium]